MASHMGVQTLATERNSQVEFFVHFILETFCKKLENDGLLKSSVVEPQKHFISEIASDVWDHHVSAIQTTGKPLEIWCQTTCYKGNGTGTPEPNKTYEIRETLVEGISLRQAFEGQDGTDFRTIHFTVGDSAYTYQWFLDLKASTYDKSIYIGKRGYDIFSDIYSAFEGKYTEEDKSAALLDAVKNKTVLGQFISSTLQELDTWWIKDGHPSSQLAEKQWNLVKQEMLSAKANWGNFSKAHGVDIKGRANAFLFAEDPEEPDPLIAQTTAMILKKNPFLWIAIKVVAEWDIFVEKLKTASNKSSSLLDFIKVLWTFPEPLHLVTRRLLLRIHTADAVSYIQDRNIRGISEHNLYGGNHSPTEVETICRQIETDLNREGITTQNQLLSQICTRGKRLVNQARWFEAKNGTELKPSFNYVELALNQHGYKTVSFTDAKMRASGFHAELSKETVRPYTNLKVITDKSGNPLAVIKAKYFRGPEFPRRCKEEAFVGLTLKYQYRSSCFSKRLGIPLIMFIDMSTDCTPPEYALKRLSSFGWNIVFSIDELLDFLKCQCEAKA